MHACKGGLRCQEFTSARAPMTQDFLRTECILQPSPHFSNGKLSKSMFPHWNLNDPKPMFPHWNLIGRPTGPRLGSRRCAKEFNMILLAWVPDRATAKPRSLLDAAVKSTYVAMWSSQHVILLQPNFGEYVVSVQDEVGNVVKPKGEPLRVCFECHRRPQTQTQPLSLRSKR